MLSPEQKRAILRSVRPKMVSIAREIETEFYPAIPYDTGALTESAFVEVDHLGTVELGYDETGDAEPHGYFVEFGTSDQAAQPTIRKTATRRRRKR